MRYTSPLVRRSRRTNRRLKPQSKRGHEIGYLITNAIAGMILLLTGPAMADAPKIDWDLDEAVWQIDGKSCDDYAGVNRHGPQSSFEPGSVP